MTRAAITPAAVVWVEGPDAAEFLQGLLSNDVARLAAGADAQALLLDATGHIRVDLRVVRSDQDAFTLVTTADSGDRLAELLDEYHFSEDVEILGPEPVDLVTFLTAPLAPPGAELTMPGAIPGTTDAIGDGPAIMAASDAAPVDPAELRALRIAAGIPVHGVDVTDRTLAHEAGLQHRAVSFDKGCYLGQETVARVEYRGGVNRRLAGIRLPAAASAGAQVSVGERVVGTLTSVAEHPTLGHIALAMIRREAADGAAVTIAGLQEPGTVIPLPFDAAPSAA